MPSRVLAAGTAAVLLLGGLGYAVADAYDVVPGVLTVRPEPTPPPPFPDPPGAQDPTTPPDDVLPALDESAPLPDRDALAAALAPLLADPALGPDVSASVVDVRTGEPLLASDAGTPREPASTVKLFTAAAAIDRLGGRRTLTTTVVPGASEEVVLVGSGDVLLGAGPGDPDAVRGRAGLADLAADTAAALAAQGRTSTAVRVDDSLFADDRMGPGWTRLDVDLGFVAPITSIAVDAGRTTDEPYAPRVADPALAAGAAFAEQLRAAGVTVVGDVTRGTAPPDAPVLAAVQSAPVTEIAGYLLRASDNTVAEAVARLVALDAGLPATFAGSARAVTETVAGLGVDVTGVTLTDGSGLSDGATVPAVALTDLLVTAAGDTHEHLRPVLTTLPVAGLSGTLLDRFSGDAAAGALGTARAKTGSLRGVTTLAGTVPSADGRLLAFAVLADDVPATEPARRAVDAVVAALAGCGCR